MRPSQVSATPPTALPHLRHPSCYFQSLKPVTVLSPLCLWTNYHPLLNHLPRPATFLWIIPTCFKHHLPCETSSKISWLIQSHIPASQHHALDLFLCWDRGPCTANMGCICLPPMSSFKCPCLVHLYLPSICDEITGLYPAGISHVISQSCLIFNKNVFALATNSAQLMKDEKMRQDEIRSSQ